MFNSAKWLLVSLVAFSACANAQIKLEGVGRQATKAEIQAWDIDVRPDFKGLPKGQGSVSRGEIVWEAQCASCHGSFGESNEVFTPIVGYTTKKDVATGKVASLQLDGGAPTRTTMMKVSQVSSLWDYINRAMPWTAPKSLSPDDVYAVTAYILHLGNVIPADFSLSDKNIGEIQKRLPNRAGTSTAHAMWPGNEFGGTRKPDTQGSSCMVNCSTEAKVASFIPDYARDSHGNLAEQSRNLGGLRGAKTVRSTEPEKEVKTTEASVYIAKDTSKYVADTKLTVANVMPILQKHACAACHAVDGKLVGPSFKEVFAKQGGRADASAYLIGKIKSGGQGVYGQIPMPAQTISEVDAQKITNWILQGVPK